MTPMQLASIKTIIADYKWVSELINSEDTKINNWTPSNKFYVDIEDDYDVQVLKSGVVLKVKSEHLLYYFFSNSKRSKLPL